LNSLGRQPQEGQPLPRPSPAGAADSSVRSADLRDLPPLRGSVGSGLSYPGLAAPG